MVCCMCSSFSLLFKCSDSWTMAHRLPLQQILVVTWLFLSVVRVEIAHGRVIQQSSHSYTQTAVNECCIGKHKEKSQATDGDLHINSTTPTAAQTALQPDELFATAHGSVTDLPLTNLSIVRNVQALGSNVNLLTETTTTICPTWHYPVNGSNSCKCGSELNGKIYCDRNSSQAFLQACNCMTYNNDTHSTSVGSCAYGCFHSDSYTSNNALYDRLPSRLKQLNNHTCHTFKRSGHLCGNCQVGYKLPSYSFKLGCIQCKYSRWNWVKYILVAYVPLTVFFVVIISCRFSATSEKLNAFILLAQGITTPADMRVFLAAIEVGSGLPTVVSIVVQMFGVLFGIWNLDFFRVLSLNICLNTSSLQELSLDYAIVCYPLVLIFATYILIKWYERNFRPVMWLWKPIEWCFARIQVQWDARASIVEVFATFLILSYVKVLSTSFDILVPTRVFTMDGRSRLFLFYNASIEYFGEEHRPYAILAMLFTLLFNILPLLLLLLYPLRSFQRCLNCCRLRSITLMIFMDAFMGHFKDGTNGSRDCRYFAGIYFLLQLFCHIAYAFTLSGYYYVLSAVFFISTAIAMTIFQPYRSRTYNIISIALLLSVGLFSISIISFSIGGYTRNTFIVKLASFMVFILALVPLLYIAGLVIYWVVVRKRVPQKCLQLFRRSQASLDAESPDLPHRLCNPQHYPPLLPVVANGDSRESFPESESEENYEPNTSPSY